MQTADNLFYAMIFISVIGSVFCMIQLFVTHILRCTLPLWFSALSMVFFCIPFLSPDVLLLSPEKQHWLDGFYIFFRLWFFGFLVLFLAKTACIILAGHALKRYALCSESRIYTVCSRCAAAVGLKKVPRLYFGTPGIPVCVAGIRRPAIIMDRTIITKLTDAELTAVFFHELTHIKRKHIFLERIYDYVCIFHWINPFVWIAKKEFSLHCEMDCDSDALKRSKDALTNADYAAAILRLLELSSAVAAKSGKKTGALRFLLVKRRIRHITSTASKPKTGLTFCLLTVCLILTILFSMRFSREHFYPYPAYSAGTEYPAGYR